MRLRKGRHLSPQRAEHIIEGAGRILAHTGIKVTDPQALEELKHKEGIEVRGDRALIRETAYRDCLLRQLGK